MIVNIKELPESKVEVEVEVKADKVDQAINKAYQKLVASANIRGFRKGKAPRAILERFVGRDTLLNEAVNDLLHEAYPETITVLNNREPLSPPKLDIEKIEEHAPFKFKATFEVMPSIALGNYKNLELARPKITVEEEELNKEIEDLRYEKGTQEPVEDRPVKEKDRVVISYEGSIEDTPVSVDKHEFEVDKRKINPHIYENILGMSLGESKEIELVFPDSHHDKKLAGKKGMVNLKVNEINRVVLPEVNDDFAKECGYESLADLEEDISKTIKQHKEEEIKNFLTDIALTKVLNDTNFEVPASLIQKQTGYLKDNLNFYLNQQKLTLPEYLKMRKIDRLSFQKELFSNAYRMAKEGIVIEEIAKKENMQITIEEMENEINKLSERFGLSVEEAKKHFAGEKVAESFRWKIIQEKVINAILDWANIAEREDLTVKDLNLLTKELLGIPEENQEKNPPSEEEHSLAGTMPQESEIKMRV